ncbi:hypothetical protein ACFOYW_08260 [Gryllotalpicola reticulitermitis]|uniref:Uncharacterized protein n=1 Tax=Gryllotalpicola reticulitermitis TaxID=1184153 RepID=A0ABV8Q6E4_9MICO
MTDSAAATSMHGEPPSLVPFVPRRGARGERSRGGPTLLAPVADQARGGAGASVGPPPATAVSPAVVLAARAAPVPVPPPAMPAALVETFGPLAPYLALPTVTDVLIAPDGALWLDEGSGLRRDAVWSLDETEVRRLGVRLVALGGRHVDESKLNI